ncbi:hypothetical protein F5Y17DRAFT_455670 [Xylariaceae sp. FL0594]|nr:hypothetical protein F5Y17DRAFT_455670 [Xylariaceae sp. FL0594]
MSSIKSVLFLATPHRGTDLAETLNRVLSSSMFGHTPREYVSELTRNSSTIDEINDSFRHHASNLRIFSFYQTLGTQIGPLNVLVLEKNSSWLGYDSETVKPLDANHHDVCKFASPDDSNYRSVRDALQSTAASLQALPAGDDESAGKELDTLREWLGATGAEEDDLTALRAKRNPGTCEDLVTAPEFTDWLTAAQPRILWAHAPPGSGKSVQCSFIIDFFKAQYQCVHWFFRHGDVDRQLVANMLRSVAYQVASQNREFRRSLVEQAKTGTQILKADAETVWRIVFAPRLSLTSDDLIWVIDAADESGSVRTLIKLMSSTGQSPQRIHLLFFSRPLLRISHLLQKARKRVQVTEVGLQDNSKDIRVAATDELEYFPASDEFKQLIIDDITTRAQGSFLWTSLVWKRILQCFRPDDVRRVLKEVPDGMDRLYDRMAEGITNLRRDEDRRLCRIILSWATYAIRPLSIEELKGEYAAEFDTFFDLNHLISQLCGEFAVINPSNQLVLVHQTAREYLRATQKLGFSLDPAEVNKELFATCLRSLGDLPPNKVLQRKTSQFLAYSAVFWSHHLDRCSAESDDVLETLFNFFSGDLPPYWIHALALNGQLSVLVNASSSLSTFVRKRRKGDFIEPPPLQRLPELALLERWAVDLLKMTAKFGNYMSRSPETIFTCIPALSPENSILFQNFSKKPTSTIAVAGLSNIEWDDCLARIPSAAGQARCLAVSNELLAEQPGLVLDEPICRISFSKSGQLLACYGFDNTWIWNVSSRAVIAKVASPRREQALALEFGPDDSYIMVTTDLRRVYKLYLNRQAPVWMTFGPGLLQETNLPEGAFISSPSSVAFNEDCTQMAVAYRGFPVTIWNINPPKVLARCRRKLKLGLTTSDSWTGVTRVVWHPFNGQILGIYRDGNIFKWGPADNTHVEVKQDLESTPFDIRCSRSGTSFCTSDISGVVKIYDYAQMVLIYKLGSDDIINAIAFAPDSQRFYDLRGSYCNVWEPNCLLRPGDAGPLEDSESIYSSEADTRGSLLSDQGADEDDGKSASLTIYASKAQVENRAAITLVATCPHNQQLFAYAKSEGIVDVYDIQREVRHSIAQADHSVGISCLALSPRGDHIAYSLEHGHVHVRSLAIQAESGKPKSVSVYSADRSSSHGSVRQLLLHGTAAFLFICGRKQCQIVRLEDDTVLAHMEVDTIERWEQHPTDPNTLLAFTATAVRAYSWETLDLKYTLPVDIAAIRGNIPEESSLTLDALLPSYYSKFHLAAMSYEESNIIHSLFVLLDTSALSSPAHEGVIRGVSISPSVLCHIDRPLGILPDGRLVFVWTVIYGSAPQVYLLRMEAR